MKRYLLFTGNQFYPSGGWNDFVGSYDTVLDAMRVVAERDPDWYNVVDTTTQEIVEEKER